jgi:hypothetical protein
MMTTMESGTSTHRTFSLTQNASAPIAIGNRQVLSNIQNASVSGTSIAKFPPHNLNPEDHGYREQREGDQASVRDATPHAEPGKVQATFPCDRDKPTPNPLTSDWVN